MISPRSVPDALDSSASSPAPNYGDALLVKLQIDRQLKILVVNKVAMCEELRCRRRPYGRVIAGITTPKIRGHRAKIFRERLDQRRKRRPVNVERREPVSDEEAGATGTL